MVADHPGLSIDVDQDSPSRSRMRRYAPHGRTYPRSRRRREGLDGLTTRISGYLYPRISSPSILTFLTIRSLSTVISTMHTFRLMYGLNHGDGAHQNLDQAHGHQAIDQARPDGSTGPAATMATIKTAMTSATGAKPMCAPTGTLPMDHGEGYRRQTRARWVKGQTVR